MAGIPVVTVASGGLPVAWVSAPPYALPVTEAANGFGRAVTLLAAGKPGLPVTYVTTAGAIVSPFTPATLDTGTATAPLSGGNLVVTGNSSSVQGAHVAAAAGKTSGKYYFEITLTTKAGGSQSGFGIGTTSSTYAGICG